MNFKKRYLVLVVLFISQFSFSQEGIAVYSDYLSDNYYLIHPSMAGAANCAKIRLTGRQQWFGQEDAPALQTLSFNGRIGEQSGAGIILFNDKNGYHSQKGVKLTYAHHIMFSRSEVDLNQLSFGISADFIQSELDETEFLQSGDFDPIINGTIVQKASYFNVDIGASYNYLLVNGERRLTPREMFRLQGFPDTYKIIANDTQARKQAGNAVPVNMVKAVILKLLPYVATTLDMTNVLREYEVEYKSE